ncbi:MAG: DNA breaking-rejoining protein [Hoylesella saccharolytica]
MSRFLIQKSSTMPNGWVLTDTLNGVVVTFEDGHYHETQKVTMLDDEPLSKFNINDLAHIMSEIGDWVSRYHSSKCTINPYGFERDEKEQLYLYRRKHPKWRLQLTDETNRQALASSLRKAAEWLIKGRWP